MCHTALPHWSDGSAEHGRRGAGTHDRRTGGPERDPPRRSTRRGTSPRRRSRPRAGGAGHRLGEVGRVLGGDEGDPRARRRLHPRGVTTARPDARPDRRRGRRRPAGGNRQLHQRRGVERRARRRRRRSSRRPAGVTRAARQPPLRRAAPRADRPLRAARHRRGPLRVGLGFRLPARLPAPHPHADVARRRHARAGHHRHGQRPGHQRRRRAVGPAHGDAARLARPSLAPPRRRSRARSRRPLRLGGRCPRRPRRLGDRVRAHRRRDRAGGCAVACTGSRRRRLLVGGRPGRARGTRGAPAGQRGQGARRHVGAGHGLRQAGPGVLHPPRVAVVSGRLLPAGRSGRPGARRRDRRAPPGGQRRADLGVLRHVRHPRAGARRRHPRRPRRRGHEHPDARDRDPAAPRPDRGAGQDPRRRRRGGARPGRLATHRHAVGVRRGEVAVAGTGACRRGRPDAPLRRRRRLPDGVPPGGARRSRPGALRPVLGVHRRAAGTGRPAHEQHRRPSPGRSCAVSTW